MAHDLTFVVDIPEDVDAWSRQDISIRGARRALLLRHPNGADVLLKRTHQGVWIAALGRPSLEAHPDGGSAVRKTFHDDLVLPAQPDLKRGEAPIALALRLLSARYGDRARRLVRFLRVCVRLYALAHLADVSHVTQETGRDRRTTMLRLHAVGRTVPAIPLPEDVASALARALWIPHNGSVPLETGMYDPVPASAHARLDRRQALLAEAEALIDPDLPGARDLLRLVSESSP
jgi:hypothetical protein